MSDCSATDVTRSSSLRRVLLLEDNQQAADVMTAGLDLRGYDVTHARTVHEAIRIWDQAGGRGFDVLLCDYFLPDGTGVDFLEHVERTGGGRAPMRIIWSGGDLRGLAGTCGLTSDHILVKTQIMNVFALIERQR
jgi:CheY-like chemotaxis protein